MADLPVKTSLPFTGAPVEYHVAADALLEAKLWGGGGAGGYVSTSGTRYAGAGGFTHIAIPVKAGDLVKVEVGQGGRKPTTTTEGGLGGWPDGGNGGYASTSICGGGGGGSTRLYINGVLAAVAGAGGATAGTNFAGSGGYWVGEAGGGSNYGGGGSQAAGGVSVGRYGDASVTGGYLRGGNGYGVGETRTTANTRNGGGGGGGYYGGGSGGSGAGSGGGSGYIRSGYDGYTLCWFNGRVGGVATGTVASSGSNGVPNAADPDYIAGVADSGRGTNAIANVTNGGDGLAVLALVSKQTVPTERTLLYVGEVNQTWTATKAGQVTIRAWGAGAGGVAGTGTRAQGGAGGMVSFTRNVVPGDTFSFQVARGGQGPTPTAGGLGGWPDGGNGGLSSTALGWGGGGGSTRVYHNSTLLAVAAGGGGGGSGLTSTIGGGGGGETGADGGPPSNANTAPGSGGTQTAGGVNKLYTTDTSYAGGYLKGGNGYPAGGSPASMGEGIGPGGGGGYYGGGGGCDTVAGPITYAGGAGGGSSLTPPNGTNAGASSYTPPGMDLPEYVTGVAGPGNASVTLTNPWETEGAGGQVFIRFEETPGAIPTQPATLVQGANVFGHTATARTITVTQKGHISATLWGGGGAGSTSGTTFRAGGDGGSARAVLSVEPGDTLRIEVGQGGQAFTASGGGAGGWPDGGSGARISGTQGWGGGGGSTRLYKNGVLLMVAGGGGGGGGGVAAAVAGGAGGGADGGPTNNANLKYGSGGSQTAGGVNTAEPTDTSYSGGYLKGGNGFKVGNARYSTGANGAGLNNGPGGGGGYYGGGSGTGTNGSLSGSAGGGSNLVPSGGEGSIGLGSTSVVGFIPGTALGSPGAAALSQNPQPGGDGLAILDFIVPNDLPTGKTAYGAIGSPRVFTVSASGLLKVKMWGGGGAGSVRGGAATPAQAGGGAYAYAEFLLKAGDTVQIDVGGGGALPGPSDVVSGPAGWPDGGRGGKYEAAGSNIGGSGGGSSRVWINGVLQLVAGAGGGAGSWYTAASSGDGGAGGARIGHSGIGARARTGDGGRDYRGGRRTTGTPGTFGDYLRAGAGFPDGTSAYDAVGQEAGPGGGGGYYGGGGGVGLATSSPGGAGGGSSFGGPQARNYRLQGGSGRTPAAVTDPDYADNAGLGGLQGAKAEALPGGDGRAVLEFMPGATLPPLPKTELALHGDQAAGPHDFITTFEGGINLALWGAGGAGSQLRANTTPPNSHGGAGGRLSGVVMFQAGDIIRVEVGQGGGAPTASTGGYGGWPDGGGGGPGTGTMMGGGGGGSTRLWRNGVLVAIAGGGGAGSAEQGRPGGYGGGLTGGAGLLNATYGGGGGAQDQGGAGATVLGIDGNYLRGGDGFQDTGSEAAAGAGGTGAVGAGGGGGYYGGGGSSGFNGGNAGSAGGGSGFLGDLLFDGILETSETGMPAGTAMAEYQPGVGVGGTPSFTIEPAMRGGPGLAVLSVFEGGLSIPATVDVDQVGTVLVTSGSGTAVGAKAGAASGTLPVVTMVPPVGAFSLGAQGSGDFGDTILIMDPQVTAQGGIGAYLPTIYVTGDLGGLPQTDALVVTGISEDMYYPTPPQTTLSAAVNYTSTTLPQVTLTPMNYILGNGYEMYDTLEIGVEPFGGGMYVADMWVGEIDSVITVSEITGSAHGDAGWAPPPNTLLSQIFLTAPKGTMRGPDETAQGDLGAAIHLNYITGEGVLPTLYGTDPFINDIEVGGIDGSATGAAHYNNRPGSGGGPFVRVLVEMSGKPLVEVDAQVSRDIGLILVGPPQAAYTRHADVRVNYFDRIYLTPPRGFAAELTAAVVDGDLSDSVILVTPPDSEGAGGYSATADLPTVYVQPAEGYVEDGQGVDVKGSRGVVVRYKRALMQGNVPVALEPLEIALNEHDGLLFAADPAGAVQAYPVGRIARGGVAPEGGQPGEILYADGVWRAPAPIYDRPVLLPPPAGDRYLTDFSLEASTSRPPAGKVVYRPFYLSRESAFAQFGVTTTAASAATARLGVCRWDQATETPGAVMLSAQVGLSGTVGRKSIEQALTLEAGWYAAMIAVTGPAPILATRRAPMGRADDLSEVGDLSAPDTGDLMDAPAPTAREAVAEAYVWATI